MEKELDQLKKEIEPYKEILGKASDIILEKEVSNYPIFVFHQHEFEIGIPIVEHEKAKGNWSVHASSLEEFVSKSIIETERIENFKSVFKDPDTHYCLFVISELGAQFIFLDR